MLGRCGGRLLCHLRNLIRFPCQFGSYLVRRNDPGTGRCEEIIGIIKLHLFGQLFKVGEFHTQSTEFFLQDYSAAVDILRPFLLFIPGAYFLFGVGSLYETQVGVQPIETGCFFRLAHHDF